MPAKNRKGVILPLRPHIELQGTATWIDVEIRFHEAALRGLYRERAGLQPVAEFAFASATGTGGAS